MDIAVLQAYVHVVDEGSFAAAARRMGISRSLSSKYISDLENSLHVRLLTRTTRSVRPTEAGLDYYHRVKAALQELDSANEAARSVSERPSGRLRIGSPVSYTLKVLNPQVMRFMATYPDIQLDLVLDDQCADLVNDGLDAVIRVGELDDSAIFARRLHGAESLIVASPAYLAEQGTPASPSDLNGHRLLHYTNMRGAATWPFHKDKDVLHQKIQPSFSSNNGDMLRAAALEGRGIAMMVDFLVADDLASGALVRVLPDYPMPALPVHLLYPSNRNMTAALRAFVDFMAKAQRH